jgi:phosphopantothenoylcysteine decarboxylase/phosphopantothenate--cysteine ligase
VVEEIEEDALGGKLAFAVPENHRPLKGKHVLVTAGPTREPIDPVRYIANRSSGRQGYAIAAAAAALGAKVTLVSGPVNLKTPAGVDRVNVETARDMADAVKKALPCDAAIMVAAVSDWRSKEVKPEKIKKRGSAPPALVLTENPDILATLAADTRRPQLLVGFAAETESLIENAKRKRKSKGVDWIVANDVSKGAMGTDDNTVKIITSKDVEHWDPMPKEEVALKLMEMVADALK